MHKVFGSKCEVSYVDRKGAYLIPFHNDRIGVVQTPKGFFLLGGGIDENETDIECIRRECLEETGYAVSVKEFVCSAETYTEHPVLGHFHPIQMYYVGELTQQIGNPTDTDHRLVWMSFEKLKGNMFLEMQSWALEQCYHYNNGDSPKADNCNSHNDEIIELTEEELDEILSDEDFESDDGCEKVRSFVFSNPDPYAKVEPRADDAPKREFSFDEKGNIVVKNPSAFWLPDVKIVEQVGGTEYTITGSYEGTETLDRKLKRILEQNAADTADDELGITEDGE